MSVCRVCAGDTLDRFLSLGPTPLANSFLTEDQLDLPEPFYPLDVYFCRTCGLVQLLDVVPPEVMFKRYPYVTRASNPLKNHFASLAAAVGRQFSLPKGSFVVDIGSNDGTLLSNFREMKTLGVDPAANLAPLARESGVETMTAFFRKTIAEEIRRERGPARVILGTNVFAHVHDLDEFLRGVCALLAADGVFVIEVPYLVDMIERLEFDTIYHEHLSYFAVRPLTVIFSRFGMRIVEVERIAVHGGSLRVYVQRAPVSSESRSVANLLDLERERRMDAPETYVRFADRVAQLKEGLLALLRALRKQGRIVGYAAPAKGNTLLNYCGIGPELLEYILDTTPFKQGRYTPGMHIPVFDESRFRTEPPEYAMLLAWNYAEEILAKETEYRRRGGKFILPIPHPRVV